MATINQALNVFRKAGLNVTVDSEEDFEYFRKGNRIVTIEIPFGTNWFEEVEGTGKMLDPIYNDYEDACRYAFTTIYGLPSQAERAIGAMDLYAKNLKEFKNRFFGDYRIPEVREIRYNGPATIVFWEDNTKTVVKVQPDEEYYDPDKAFAMAVCKKLFGNKFNRHLTKAQKAYEKSCEEEYDERVKEFIKDPVKVIYCALDDFDKFWSKYNPSVKEGTFDPDSVTTFKTEFNKKA